MIAIKNLLNVLPLLILAWTITSCQTLSRNFDKNKFKKSNIQLGSIGEENDVLFRTTFETLGFLNISKPIKLNIQTLYNNKITNENYINALNKQENSKLDSTQSRQKFVELEIADKIALINILNNENETVKTYLKNNKTANIVTSVSVAYEIDDYNSLIGANAIFLQEPISSLKGFQIQTKDSTSNIINPHKGIVYSYKLLKPCWKENDKGKVQIIDLTKNNKKCSKGSYRDAKDAIKKIDYFKL